MKIAVIADTHIPGSAAKMPSKLYTHLKNCDLIIHAGDLVEMAVLEELRKIAETKAVYGNMDGFKVRKALPEKIVLKTCGKSIGITHGKGAPAGIVERAKKAFKDEKLDIIIFGHSHAPFNKVIDGTLFFNPGSPTDKVFAPYRSFGIIEIEGNTIKAEIVRL